MAQETDFMTELRSALARIQNSRNIELVDVRVSTDTRVPFEGRFVNSGSSKLYPSFTLPSAVMYSHDRIRYNSEDSTTTETTATQTLSSEISTARINTMDCDVSLQTRICNHAQYPEKNGSLISNDKNTPLWNKSIHINKSDDCSGFVSQLTDGLKPGDDKMPSDQARDPVCGDSGRMSGGNLPAGEAKHSVGHLDVSGQTLENCTEMKCTKVSAAKEACTDLFEELNVVLQRRKQSGSKVNILDIERMKTGKSIMYFGARPAKEESPSQTNASQSCPNGRLSAGENVGVRDPFGCNSGGLGHLGVDPETPLGENNLVSRSIKNFEKINLASSASVHRTLGDGNATNNNFRLNCLHCDDNVGLNHRRHLEADTLKGHRSEVASSTTRSSDSVTSQHASATEMKCHEMSRSIALRIASDGSSCGDSSQRVSLPSVDGDQSTSKSPRDLSDRKIIELKTDSKAIGQNVVVNDQHVVALRNQKRAPVDCNGEKDAGGRSPAADVKRSAAPPPPPLPPIRQSNGAMPENLATSDEIVYKDAYLSTPTDGEFREELLLTILKLQAKRNGDRSLGCPESEENGPGEERGNDREHAGAESDKTLTQNDSAIVSELLNSSQKVDDSSNDTKNSGKELPGDESCDELFGDDCITPVGVDGPTDEQRRGMRRLPRIHFVGGNVEKRRDARASADVDPGELRDDAVQDRSEEPSVSSCVADHPGTLISDLVNSIRCQVTAGDGVEFEISTPSDQSSGLSDIIPPDVDGTSSSAHDSTTKSVSSVLFPSQCSLLLPQESHISTNPMSTSMASVVSVEASTAFTTFDDDDDDDDDGDGADDDYTGDGGGSGDEFFSGSLSSKESCTMKYPSYLSKSVENVAPEESTAESKPIQTGRQDAPANVGTDVEDGFATYPPPKMARNRTLCAGADREIITSLMITHSGDRIPPDGAEVQAGQYYGGRLNSNVTVPEPTSFHQHGNNVGKHFLSPANRRVTAAEVHRNASLLRAAVPSISEPAVDRDPSDPGAQRPVPRHVSLDKEAQRYMLYYTWSSNSARRHQPKCNNLRRVKHEHADEDSDSSSLLMEHRLLTDTIPDKRSPVWKSQTGDDKSRAKTGADVGIHYKRKLSTHLINADLAQSVAAAGRGRNAASADDGSDGDTESLCQGYDKYEAALIRSIKPRDLCLVDENISSLYRQQLEGAAGISTLVEAPSSFLHRLTCCFICQSHHSLVSTFVDTNRAHRARANSRRSSSACADQPKSKHHKNGASRRHLVQADSPPATPITQNIIDGAALVTAFGQGLQTAEKGQPARFMIDTKGRRGNIEVHVKGTHTISQVQLDPVGTQYQATYVPMETGLFQVSVLWNGQPISGSPFHVNVAEAFDINSITPVGGWQAVLDNEGKMFLKSRVINTVDFDTSKASHCTLSATVESPTREIVPVTVEKTMNGMQTTISFIPRIPGMYQIRIFCNDVCLPRCPIPAVATDPIDHEKVVLTGLGLQEAVVNQQAEFIIDGTEAGPGEPDVKLTGVKKDIPVHLEPIGANKYKASYVPVIPGAYLLSITWNNRLVRGSPFKVNIKSGANASKVSVNTDGFRQSVFGKEIKAIIDTRRAGPGELTAHCMGPNKVAYCELLDHRDGTFTLSIRPQEPGKHILQVKYGGEHVPGSPFLLKVAGPPDASKVRVSGPGVESGILANFQSRFIVETRGAGAGQLTVRIRGPKGAFRVEMQRESQKDRTILCRYDPTEVGTYIIHVKWSGEHVPGSPFTIQIFDTLNELNDYLANSQNRLPRSYPESDQWSENL